MLNPVVSCVVSFCDLLIIYVFFSRVAEGRVSAFKCFLIGFCLFETWSAVNLMFQNNLWGNTIASVLIRILFGMFCFQMRPLRAIGYAVILVVLNFALEMVSVLLISSLAGANMIDYNRNLSLLIIECASCKILFFSTCIILSHFVVPNAQWSHLPISLLYYPLGTTICLMIFWYIGLQEGVTSGITYILAIASIILFGSTVLLFLTYEHQMELDRERIRIKNENDRLQTEKSYYDILEQQNQQLMLYAHDTKKHLSAIAALTEDPAIEDYIGKLLDQLKTYSRNCHSGNKLLDVMVNKYLTDCQLRGIRFEYDVQTCNLNLVKDIDLVAILGNLMDNALTAAEQSQDPFVTLETTQRNNYRVVVISNRCDTPPSTHGGRLVSSKEDKKLHGYGLKSVAQTLKKYDGDFSWDYNEMEHTFVVTVMIGTAK